LTHAIAGELNLMLINPQKILKDRPGLDIIYKARNGDDLLEATRHCKPDVILFYERFDPFIDVLALVEQLKHSAPQARLIMLGELAGGLRVRDLFAHGVRTNGAEKKIDFYWWLAPKCTTFLHCW
jgi:DNA-binding NarL/FixJ family response regulator